MPLRRRIKAGGYFNVQQLNSNKVPSRRLNNSPILQETRLVLNWTAAEEFSKITLQLRWLPSRGACELFHLTVFRQRIDNWPIVQLLLTRESQPTSQLLKRRLFSFRSFFRLKCWSLVTFRPEPWISEFQEYYSVHCNIHCWPGHLEFRTCRAVNCKDLSRGSGPLEATHSAIDNETSSCHGKESRRTVWLVKLFPQEHAKFIHRWVGIQFPYYEIFIERNGFCRPHSSWS